MSTGEAKLRIGELSRRTGVSPSVLRTWEHRYAVIAPERSSGGLRLFSEADEQRIHAMRAHMRSGLSAAEAARAARAGEPPEPPLEPSELSRAGRRPTSELTEAALALADGLGRLDRELAHRAIDRLLAAATFETVASQVLLPYLADVGARWERGEPAIAEEHFASQLLRGRLLSLAEGTHPASGPRVVLACPEQELHDIALVILAVALARHGWNVALLGANTPTDALLEAVEQLDAECVVVSAVSEDRLAAVARGLRSVARRRQLLLAGPGASARVARRVGAQRLSGDPIAAAGELATRAGPTARADDRPRA